MAGTTLIDLTTTDTLNTLTISPLISFLHVIFHRLAVMTTVWAVWTVWTI